MITDLHPDIVLKVLWAFLFGCAIGIERELRNKSAGFRTMILICTGAALFTICSKELGGERDFTRIASNIVVGVGFLGAGVIFKTDYGNHGITTAAAIWVTAAIGMLVGIGYVAVAAAVTVLVIIVLFLFSYIERQMDLHNHRKEYKIEMSYAFFREEHLKEWLKAAGLKKKQSRHTLQGSDMSIMLVLTGSKKGHHDFVENLLQHPEIKRCSY